MVYFYKNLFQDMIKDLFFVCQEINIISAYASPIFLEKILSSGVRAKLNLYIGMALEGIYIEEHRKYLQLMSQYDNLNVFYQVRGPLSHIKLYHLKNVKEVSYYVGSANFSENGFEINRELLVKVDDDLYPVLEEIKSASLEITNNLIDSLIPFYLRESKARPPQGNEESDNNRKDNPINQKFLHRNRRGNYGNKLTIPILLETDPLNGKDGVNARFYKRESRLIISNSYLANQLLGVNSWLTFITDDNMVFQGRRNPRKTKEILFEPDIYTYIAHRIGMNEYRPIEYSDLNNYGRTEIEISKLSSDDAYYLDFSV